MPKRRVRAWCVVVDTGFLRVCLIQPHFLRSICLATGYWEGMLARKHEKDGDKKACNRSWENVYAMMRGASMSCYKDLEHAKSDPNTHIHHESAIDLHGACCDVARDYGKRPYVFRLKLSDGSEYLFQAKNAGKQENWIERINSVTGVEGAGIPTGFQQVPDTDRTKQGASSH